MSKKFITLALILGVVVGLGAGGYYFFTSKQVKKPLLNNSLIQDLTETMKKDEIVGEALYKDESGFSFYYPKDLVVKDITPDDGVYYSKVTLTKDGKQLTVSVLDTKETTIDSYIKKNELLKGATLYGATKLGDIMAKQYQTASFLSTIAIDQGILYLVEGPKDGDFWEKTQGVVVDSFTIGEPKGSSNPAGGGDNTIYEPEEVVE